MWSLLIFEKLGDGFVSSHLIELEPLSIVQRVLGIPEDECMIGEDYTLSREQADTLGISRKINLDFSMYEYFLARED